MTNKTLTDPDGDTLSIDSLRSGRVCLTIHQGGTRAVFGPIDPVDLIAAIRKATGDTTEPANLTEDEWERLRQQIIAFMANNTSSSSWEEET